MRQLRAIAHEVKVIDVFDAPKDVIKQIAQCDFILSSSLHGLIVADSLKISPPTLNADDISTVEDCAAIRESYERLELDRVKQQLQASFPNF
ncbi:MAG TPA: hypothetical protein DCX06_00360 [Opitutae bacterium]|nr:hypothetical protein [Opitutae bacterium]